MVLQVPRHIQKQREEAAAAAGQQAQQVRPENGLSIQTSGYDSSEVMPEMDEEIWTPSEPTPIAQHFSAKPDMQTVSSPGWQSLNPS